MKRTFKANPGGNLSAEDVFGRDELIDQLWGYLEAQSIVMTAERRQGKTQILKKMAQEPRQGWLPVYQDLEKVNSTEEFAHGFCEKVQLHLGAIKKVANRVSKWFHDHFKGVPGVIELQAKQHCWKALLQHAVDDLIQEQGEKRLLFFWDEFPWMLDNIRRRQGDETAMEVLAILRSLRQDCGGPFRMVLTGSIGLHHVLERLKEGDQVNAPLNDTFAVKVPPLAQNDAAELANRLLAGEEIPSGDQAMAARSIAMAVDCRPYYIHHVVRRLKATRRPAEPASVNEAVAELLVDANDTWELGHFRDRIAKYYGPDADLVRAILDELAVATAPMSVPALLERIKAQRSFDDRTKLLEMLRLLERDHYLIRLKDGAFSFEFPLLARWWKLDRGL